MSVSPVITIPPSSTSTSTNSPATLRTYSFIKTSAQKPSIAAPSPRVHRRISARIGQYIDHKFSNEKKKGPVPSSGVADSGVTTTGGDKGKNKESFVSGSAEPHLPTTHTHTTTSATAPAAAEVVGSAPPVLGAPVKVEPMGELEVCRSWLSKWRYESHADTV